MTPAEVMASVTKRFTDEGVTTYEINDGQCVEWAEEVMEKLLLTDHHVELWETLFGFADTSHMFVRIDGKFFDAEESHGVEDHMQLPIFARMTKAGAPRQPVWAIDANKPVIDGRRDITLDMLKQYDEENETNNSGLFPENSN